MHMLLVPPTMLLVPLTINSAAGSNVVFLCLFCFCPILSVIFYFIPGIYLLLSSINKPYERSRVASVDDEPALLVPYQVLSDAEGRGIVDERRTETADRVARYQAD